MKLCGEMKNWAPPGKAAKGTIKDGKRRDGAEDGASAPGPEAADSLSECQVAATSEQLHQGSSGGGGGESRCMQLHARTKRALCPRAS